MRKIRSQTHEGWWRWGERQPADPDVDPEACSPCCGHLPIAEQDGVVQAERTGSAWLTPLQATRGDTAARRHFASACSLLRVPCLPSALAPFLRGVPSSAISGPGCLPAPGALPGPLVPASPHDGLPSAQGPLTASWESKQGSRACLDGVRGPWRRHSSCWTADPSPSSPSGKRLRAQLYMLPPTASWASGNTVRHLMTWDLQNYFKLLRDK